MASKRQEAAVAPLRPSAIEPISLDGSIFLLVPLSDLIVRVWLAVDMNLAVYFLLENSFIDRYTRIIFSSERKSILRHSAPGTILNSNLIVDILITSVRWTGQ